MKLGIALSGGGIRGIAHAGVLKALEDNNIKIDVIGGTSSGAIIATYYAMGYSPLYIYKMFKKYSKQVVKFNGKSLISRIVNFISKNDKHILGLKDGSYLEKLFEKEAKLKKINNFSQIKFPIVVPAVDIKKSKEYIFTNEISKDVVDKEQYITDISIGKALRASSSFPIIFTPCYYKNHAFLDGGILDNIPENEVRKKGADKVISVKFDSDRIDKNSNIMDLTMKIIDIMGNKISEESIEKSDLILSIYTDKVGLLDIKKLDKCYRYGYDYTIKNIDKIKQLINY